MEETKKETKEINLDKSPTEIPQKKRKDSGENFESIVRQISKDFGDCEPLERLSEKLKLKPGKIIIVYFLASFVLVLLGLYIVTDITGLLYPAYATINYIENSQRLPDKAKIQWITYWIVFTLFFLTDYIVYFFSFLELSYYLLKLMILIWLFYPKTQGATTVYNRFLRNYFKIIEEHIENLMDGPWS